ncbi:MAG: class I SAM-dependent RNA methyltransferase, partial [Burkholderiaceae bacterium]
APGSLRRFAFEKMLPFQQHVWEAIRHGATQAQRPPRPWEMPRIFGSDVAHRMVDFAQRNAQRAGVAEAIEFRGGDALQRMPPAPAPGVMLVNPPYGERIEAAGIAGAARRMRHGTAEQQNPNGHRSGSSDHIGGAQPQFGRQSAQTEDGGDFFVQLAAHWKKNYAGWTAWVLTPDRKLPGKMRLKETRRVPMWNGPIECRLLRFDMVKGSARPAAAPDAGLP